MNCPLCKTAMQKRNGKFGPFFYCQPHGTISLQGKKLHTTGEITSKIKSLVTSKKVTSSCDQKDLEILVRIEMAKFGVLMNDLDLFIEGGAQAAHDEPDHWMNSRPF